MVQSLTGRDPVHVLPTGDYDDRTTLKSSFISRENKKTEGVLSCRLSPTCYRSPTIIFYMTPPMTTMTALPQKPALFPHAIYSFLSSLRKQGSSPPPLYSYFSFSMLNHGCSRRPGKPFNATGTGAEEAEGTERSTDLQ